MFLIKSIICNLERTEFLWDFLQMSSVGAVEPSDHQNEINVLLRHQFCDGILSLLCRVADGIEFRIMFTQDCGAEFLEHSHFEQSSDLLGLALIHGGLVSQADLLQVDVRVEAFGYCVLESTEEFFLVAALQNIL